jgi:thiamine-phosphate pyrophosphorylase
MPVDWSLYLVTDRGLSRGRSAAVVVEAALRGGATVVQYREKAASTRRMIEEASELAAICRRYGAAFIVNDRLDVALAVDADGLHVGQGDMPADVARRLLGPGKLLGVSAGSVEEALRAAGEGADYIGASPVFATPTKEDAGPALGLEGLAAMSTRVSLPVVAIGGINLGNARALLIAGAAGLAVVSAIVAAEDVEGAARSLRLAIESWKKEGSR